MAHYFSMLQKIRYFQPNQNSKRIEVHFGKDFYLHAIVQGIGTLWMNFNFNIYSFMKNMEVPVLMYHQFVSEVDKNSKIKTFITARHFELQLKILKMLGYTTTTFRDLQKIGLENRFKKKYIILTVDDGYSNNYEYMFPLLSKYNMKAVIYLVTGLDHNRWDMANHGEQKLPMMSKAHVKELIKSELIEIGSHTITHANLPTVSHEDQVQEIAGSKEFLEKTYGIKVTSFAYPYGQLNEAVKEVVKDAGYTSAVSANSGTGKFEDDLFEIRRSGINKDGIISFLVKISQPYTSYKGTQWKKQFVRL
ncbi:MAG: polysaccharide deacetylase family protein [Cyclobacteriaceae bacterium]|nr:polysaccharide deacetylase family protein [Cyclobacteriaceae bacterium]